MRQLFADHEPADVKANVKFLIDSRSDATTQVAPTVFMLVSVCFFAAGALQITMMFGPSSTSVGKKKGD